jgi:hypothetical protein
VKLLYLIGEPGVGKTTLMANLTAKLAAPEPGQTIVGYNNQKHKVPYVQWDTFPDVAEVGVRRPQHGGTDALGLHMSPVIGLWLQDRPFTYVLAEGDRCANSKFFGAVRHAGYELCLVHLSGPELAAERRTSRGTTQTEQWVNSRRTRAERLTQEWGALVLQAEDAFADHVRHLANTWPDLTYALNLTSP